MSFNQGQAGFWRELIALRFGGFEISPADELVKAIRIALGEETISIFQNRIRSRGEDRAAVSLEGDDLKSESLAEIGVR